jgi:Ion transport protein
MGKKNKKILNPIKRNNYDFEMLYFQQIEMQRLTKQSEIHLIKLQSKYADKPYSETSLIFLPVTNPFRNLCIKLILNPYFDYFILTVIIANCIGLVLDDQIQSTSLSFNLDLAFLSIFTLELVLKVIATGFI